LPLFKIIKIEEAQTAKRVPRKEDGFGSENALRDFFAKNLEEILGIRFLGKEYHVADGSTDGRIDTLGIDGNDFPVIIEYKWKESEEVLTQGLSYFKWLMKNKKHFELLVKHRLGSHSKVNWEHPRLILVARAFNKFVIAAAQMFKNVELKTYTYYNPDILYIENVFPSDLKVSEHMSETSLIEKGPPFDFFDVNVKKTSEKMKAVFLDIRIRILAFPNTEEVARKSCITYRNIKSSQRSKRFVTFEFRPSWIQVLIRDFDYVDPQHLIKDVSTFDWGYKGAVKLRTDSDVDYIFRLIELSYQSSL